jgi:hypothetical protein
MLHKKYSVPYQIYENEVPISVMAQL